MQRNSLSIRARTAVCQKLPADFQAKVDGFCEFIEKQVTEHNVSPDDQHGRALFLVLDFVKEISK